MAIYLIAPFSGVKRISVQYTCISTTQRWP